jgi:WD40 repeat protein
MFRPKIIGNESDRFITARGSQRDRLIERYNIHDQDVRENPQSPVVRDRSKTPTRTAVIIKDEKQISEKLYLSLLKTQLLKTARKEDTSNSYLSSSNHLSKKRMKFFTKQINRSPSGKLGEEDDSLVGLSSISKKLNFNNVKTDYKVKRQKFEDADFNRQDWTRNSFKDLIDFQIAKEDIKCIPDYNAKGVPTSSYKILDAPGLKDDFYLHLLDWSVTDTLAVGLGNAVYLWNGIDASVEQLHDFEDNEITSVQWLSDGHRLAVGLFNGVVNIFDTSTKDIVTKYYAHSKRVGIMSRLPNNPNLFSSGSLDKHINTYDIRTTALAMCHTGHPQEVCGLKWSHDGRMLASGGNDNKLMLWSLKKQSCENKFNAHNSAVRAIDWSYSKFGLLASGGGAHDRTIKFWNTNEMLLVDSIDTTSQVCDIAFSKITNEFVTTHGYSDNLILIWDYPKMEVTTTLKGHKERVLYLSTSPDGRKIVTGAGDETLRFWDVFKKDDVRTNSPKLKLFNIR